MTDYCVRATDVQEILEPLRYGIPKSKIKKAFRFWNDDAKYERVAYSVREHAIVVLKRWEE